MMRHSRHIIPWAFVGVLGLGALQIPASSRAEVSRAPASYDQVVTWSDMSDLDLRAALRSQYGSHGNLLDANISPSSYEIALTDADAKISTEFKIPTELKPTVAFWLKIYTEYTTQHSVIFDSRHPELVYDVLDFRELARTARNAVVYEIVQKQRIRKTMAAYRKAFAHLAKGAKPKTREELNIMSALKNLNHHHSFRELAQNLRSQTGQRDNIMKGLLAAEAFFPRMEQIFKQEGAPPQLTRLALVESSFDLRAHSFAGAQGVWQFMPNIGKKFMLIDDANRIDERLSPLKSTVAAGRMMMESYARFRNWPLAVTSYNHGLKGLPKAKSKSETKEFAAIAPLFKGCWRKSPLGWAGRNYYAEFLAVLHAERYRELFYGEPPVNEVRPVVFKAVTPGRTGLTIAMESGVAVQEFKLLNPDIKDLHKRLPKNFSVALPGQNDDITALLVPSRRSRRQTVALRD